MVSCTPRLALIHYVAKDGLVLLMLLSPPPSVGVTGVQLHLSHLPVWVTCVPLHAQVVQTRAWNTGLHAC